MRFIEFYTVSVGSPFDGMRLFGEFDDRDDAREWAEYHCEGDVWSVVPVECTDRSDIVKE